jgi:hypothetical protein
MLTSRLLSPVRLSVSNYPGKPLGQSEARRRAECAEERGEEQPEYRAKERPAPVKTRTACTRGTSTCSSTAPFAKWTLILPAMPGCVPSSLRSRPSRLQKWRFRSVNVATDHDTLFARMRVPCSAFASADAVAWVASMTSVHCRMGGRPLSCPRFGPAKSGQPLCYHKYEV